MKIYVKNTEQGLIPLYESDRKTKVKLKLGKEYLCEIKHPRNGKFHKKFMALVNLGFANQKIYTFFDDYRYDVVILSGNYTLTPEGNKKPKSIAFANMEQEEFEKLYNDVLQVIAKLLGNKPEIIEANLLGFM